MRYIVYIFFLFPVLAIAQTYKYIGIEDGLSNRRISNIKKDVQGYMWFLTNEGIDRYNGKDIKHYNLNKENDAFNSRVRPGWLYIASQVGIWVIGKKGGIFQYNSLNDQFKLKYKMSNNTDDISFGYLDRNNNIWLCGKDSILRYNISDAHTSGFPNVFHVGITAIEQIDDDHFFVATEIGVRYARLENGTLQVIPIEALDYFHAQVSVLYFHEQQKRLFIGSFERGIFVYDMITHKIIYSESELSDVNITQICPLNETELLVSTEGMGVYKMDMGTCKLDPYILANYKSYNEMNGNNINDVFVDEEKRIWLANYPIGVTIIDNRYKNYQWMKHAMGNDQSLINDQVHAVIEDSEGDLWFGTSNGISLYNYKTGQWHSFLSFFDHQLKDKNHIFITLCEVSPGVIWAGGYTSGIYKINKKTLSVEYFSPYLISHNNMRPDKFIRDIEKDSRGNVWSGGYYNLKCFDLKTNDFRLYPGVNSITAIAEKDIDNMWIGSSSGLYLLNKDSGKFQNIEMNVGSSYVTSLYQADNGLLFIGTNGSGMLIYNAKQQTFEHYFTDNSALISNIILTILPEVDGQIMMSTENGITCFYTKDKVFRNWTRGEGLLPAYYNASSGTVRRNKSFVFGSTEGAIEIPRNIKFPEYKYTQMVFSDFHISYQPVSPGEKDSPLMNNINQTKVLKLKHSQNTFSLKVSTINYDSPGNVIYTWKLEGFYNKWSQPGASEQIRFTNVPSGKYTLHVRAISREENDKIFEERAMKIIIAQPYWLSWWAISFYLLLIGGALIFVLRTMNLRKIKKYSDEKTQFFINTAHDIRTPLTLIKAPLEEMLEDEDLSNKGTNLIQIALDNIGMLLQLTNNLINFERVNVYSSELSLSEHELNSYIKDVCRYFYPYASTKKINFKFENSLPHLNVWFDKEKMDSILKNILSNALKYTLPNGEVRISVQDNLDNWCIIVKDTGIGIPTNEKNKLFKLYYRASNVINSKISGVGIGLMLVAKLVRLHGGDIKIDSVVHQGTTIKLIFPKDNEHYSKSTDSQTANESDKKKEVADYADEDATLKTAVINKELPRLLIVEDNDELRSYLQSSLNIMYTVQTCNNGVEALIIIKEYWPDLIISDIMMPEMTGLELCEAVKKNVETSHIPVLLLTALEDENSLISGLQIGADDYIIKPFSLRLLRASVANLLANRELLRSKYAIMETGTDIVMPTPKCTNSLDWKFIADVKKIIDDNMCEKDFAVGKLHTYLNMCRSSFFNKLKALTGMSPQEVVKLRRLIRAAELLKKGEHTIGEISDLCGFSDAKYFRVVFKKEFDKSPREFAKANGIAHMVDDEETSPKDCDLLLDDNHNL